MRNLARVERNHEIYNHRKNGMTYRRIAEIYGISIIRVRQILEAERLKEAADDQSGVG